MFPFRDHNPSGRMPFVTMALILANVVAFLLTYPGASDYDLSRLYYWWGVRSDRIFAGLGLETLVTHMFLHGSWMHLIGNMLFLWIYGDNLEEKFGHFGFVVFYLACGLVAAFAQMLLSPDGDVPMVGASGAIAGVMGGYLLLFPRARVDVLVIFIVFFKVFSLPAWGLLGFWIVSQFAYGMIGVDDAVAYWAHAGGFVAGLALTGPVWLRLGGRLFWARFDGHPDHPEARYPLTQSRILRIRR